MSDDVIEDVIAEDISIFERPGLRQIDFTPRTEERLFRNKRGELVKRVITVGPKTPVKKALLALSSELLSMGDIVSQLAQPIAAQRTADRYRKLPNLSKLNLRVLAAAIVIVLFRAGIEYQEIDVTATTQFQPVHWNEYVNRVKSKIIEYYKGPFAEINLQADLYRYVSILID